MGLYEVMDVVEYFVFPLSQVCKNPLRNLVQCESCRMVSYCNEDHRRSDAAGHKDLCSVIVEIARRRGNWLVDQHLCS